MRTTEGVGVWSEPKVATRAEPGESFVSSVRHLAYLPSLQTEIIGRQEIMW